ncbi:hypothetical protein RD792_004625 [Penstemon davidsonii]|uniref:BURP domain-containing protein n=1 Tax=Penstemon davidsonii TaxID=160366 RepID=A0ABR0DHW5_9LAMI|nr:hypothetical protein RD792_004625 [Penstemon davidsonii]
MHSTGLFPLLLLLVTTFCYIQITHVGVISAAGENPFTPKGYLIRYWNKKISNNLPKPKFLLDKASPLTAAQYAEFSKLAGNKISFDFCAKANLFCTMQDKHKGNVNFASYSDKNFTNYGTHRLGGLDSFKNYTTGDTDININSFHQYSRDSVDHRDKFTSYTKESNLVQQSFDKYGTTAAGGQGKFKNYYSPATVANLYFTSYSDNSNGRQQSFTEYTNKANAGEEIFTNYGKDGTGASNEFTSYAKQTAIMDSTFTNYGENGNVANDTFTSYATDQAKIATNTFRNYGTKGNSATETFKTYVNNSVFGHDNFETYGKNSNSGEVDFENYGQTVTYATDIFSGYGNDTNSLTVDFKIYGVSVENTFKEYAKHGVKFSKYSNGSSTMEEASSATSGEKGIKKWVEPGKFFREEKLKTGTFMPMPDIRDKMPKRSFLPRAIVSKLPFSTSKLEEMKKIFHTGEDSSLTKMLTDSLSECERAPSPGETKQCVASIEDMIDFATSVLGRNVVVRTTEKIEGSNSKILLGEVKGINGGNVTKSVSCHQSLYPYLLYYCHSVPNVRVYEADILDPESKAKINHGVSICHLDTGSWSPGHGAFIALGSSPGRIEVCHWIFENDMTWAIAD